MCQPFHLASDPLASARLVRSELRRLLASLPLNVVTAGCGNDFENGSSVSTLSVKTAGNVGSLNPAPTCTIFLKSLSGPIFCSTREIAEPCATSATPAGRRAASDGEGLNPSQFANETVALKTLQQTAS